VPLNKDELRDTDSFFDQRVSLLNELCDANHRSFLIAIERTILSASYVSIRLQQ
jgi:hypothetical protein|tara:strand:- start:2386 stop:2547 length:162 start_codon:yes stop_codon:yes gene_type:complete